MTERSEARTSACPDCGHAWVEHGALGCTVNLSGKLGFSKIECPCRQRPEDPRKTGLKTGLRQLTNDQLQKVLRYEGEFVLDTFNYCDGKFCPLAVALDLPATLATPTNAHVIATLQNLGYKVFNTRGITGTFYTTDRRRDLLIATREVLVERSVVRPSC